GNLEGEQVLPFRPTGVQKRNLAARGFEEQKAIVLYRHVPEVGVGTPLDAGEVAQEPAREVDQVRPLVDQLPASGNSRLGTPFPIVARTPAMAVPAADEHHLAQRARFEDLAGLAKRPMVAMVESNSDQRPGAAGGRG